MLYKIIFNLKKIYWFLFRPRTFGVKCILENSDNILMIRRTFGTDKWVFPGGVARKGEKPDEAIKREIKEDLNTGLDGLQYLGSFMQKVHYRQETIHCFLARVLSKEFDYNKEKIKETKWFNKSQLPFLTPISKSVILLYEKYARSKYKNTL